MLSGQPHSIKTCSAFFDFFKLNIVFSAFYSLVWVWIWKISPKITIFQFFLPVIKKISSGRVKKYPGQRQVSLLFTARQKYARVGSGQGHYFLPARQKCKAISQHYKV